ncbi:MAG: T9SS type A sorting domain-containing protein, partial [Saprospiraceae bacterium]|nr:T9SS type A sorting domain-containing protein [Saprospiraceae bacterium]
LTLCFSLGLLLSGYAQERIFLPGKTFQVKQQHARATDIVSYPVSGDECASTVVPYPSNGWGYVGGTNVFGDRVKAQHLEFTGSAVFTVIGALAYFDTPSVVGDSSVTAKVYEVVENAPGELLSTSLPVRVSQITPPSDTSVEFTIFPFNDSMSLESPQFFVGIDFTDLYSSMDTLGLFSTLDSCGDGSNTFEMWSDGTWASFDTTWFLNADLLIEAIVEFAEDTTVAADDYIKYNGLRLFPATPNPADAHTVLNYGLDKDQEVRISLLDVSGRIVREINPGLKHAGQHQEQVHTFDMSPGTYYYRISTPAGSLVSTFIVQR